MKAPPNGGEITTNTNHFTNVNGGERQTWVRGAGIDIPISANNESFPFRSEVKGEQGKEPENRRKWGMDEGKKGGAATMEGYHS